MKLLRGQKALVSVSDSGIGAALVQAFAKAGATVWLVPEESDHAHATRLFVDGGMTVYQGFSQNG